MSRRRPEAASPGSILSGLSPSDRPGPGLDGARREALVFGILCAGVYAALAVTFCARAPRLFEQLDQLFDADLGVWTIALTHPGARLPYYTVHPLITLFVLPWGSALRELLRWFGVPAAGRLAAGLLCALAGGASAGAFRLLLGRLGVRPRWARGFASAFALSATQVVFSSLPESHAFSTLGLVLVFLSAAAPGRARCARLAAGVFSFGVTATGLAAVAFSHLDWRRDGRRAPLAAARAVALVLVVAVALALLQQAMFPGARPFFRREPLGTGYTSAVATPSSLRELTERLAMVASYMTFVGMAAPRLARDDYGRPAGALDFDASPLPRLRPAGAVHAVLWVGLVALALWGLRRAGGEARRVSAALLAWLAFVFALHLFFGRSLFLFSGQWAFAVVALTAAGLEARPVGRTGEGLISAGILLGVGLQAVANASLVADVLRAFSGP